MDVYKARQLLKTCRIQDMEMRVVHYDRVSTDKEEQKSSMINQAFLSEDIIKKEPNWVYAGSYVDDAISGLTVNKRQGFQQMLKDAENGKFDFIITKEIARFARNTLDSIKYSRILLKHGVGIWFINNNINTFSEDSEFLLTIMSGMAQDESRRISSRVKTGHSVSIKRGRVLGTDNMYGYEKKDCKLTIDESTSDAVKYIFEHYANGNSSTHKLSEELFELGYKNRYGSKISSKTIQNIIRNPKYKGYYCGGKVIVEDMFTKKQRFIPESDWIMYKDENVPAIVSEELWNKANEVLDSRSRTLFGEGKTSYKHDNLFTGKIICANDGASYWLRARGKKGARHDLTWECSVRKKQHAAACDSFAIKESELLTIIEEIINEKLADIEPVLEEYLDMLKKLLESNNNESAIKKLEKEIEQIKYKRNKILDHNLCGRLSDEDFYERDTEFKAEEVKCKEELEKLNSKSALTEYSELSQQIRQHIKYITSIKTDDITKTIIDDMFDKIIAKKIAPNTMELTFVTNTGGDITKNYAKRCSKNTQSLKNLSETCRSDTVIKKMIEQQEKQMAGK